MATTGWRPAAGEPASGAERQRVNRAARKRGDAARRRGGKELRRQAIGGWRDGGEVRQAGGGKAQRGATAHSPPARKPIFSFSFIFFLFSFIFIGSGCKKFLPNFFPYFFG